MDVIPTKISGVFIIESSLFSDHRGLFGRVFCKNELSNVIGYKQIVQINYSQTKLVGAIRGLHFQYPPNAEMKFIRCLKGKVFDAAVDLRKNSPTFLKWYTEELSSKNNKMIVIPEGCAHGFQVLEENSELIYLHTEFYNKPSEGGIRYDDPSLAIPWPKIVSDISEKDKKHSLITDHFEGVEV